MKRQRVVHKSYLDTKADIPFTAAQLIIYQPSIVEITMMGEPQFFVAVNSLTKDYKSLNLQDNFDLDSYTNFDILMSIMREKTDNSRYILLSIIQLLDLIFPRYKISFTPRSFIFQEKERNENEPPQTLAIDSNNFEEFSNIIYDMFGLAALMSETETDYNPQGDRARAIVEKFKKRQELLAKQRKQRGEDTELNSVFGRYINILAIGEKKNKNELCQYSVYQLIEEFKRFQLKETFDYTFQARMAGAQNVKDAKDWMQDITLGVELEE